MKVNFKNGMSVRHYVEGIAKLNNEEVKQELASFETEEEREKIRTALNKFIQFENAKVYGGAYVSL